MEFLLERSHCVFQQGGWRVLMDASGFQPNSRHWSWIPLRYGATTFVSLGDDVEEGVSLRHVNDSAATGRAELFIAGAACVHLYRREIISRTLSLT